MDRQLQMAVIRQKIEDAKSTNANLICNSITDILGALKVLEFDDDFVIESLVAAYDVADISLGFGEKTLNSMYANQVKNLLNDFSAKLKIPK